MFDNMTLDELLAHNKEVVAEIRKRYRAQESVAVQGFAVNDRVQFNIKKWPFVIKGTVEKINTKSVAVKPDGGGVGWKVSPSFLTKIS